MLVPVSATNRASHATTFRRMAVRMRGNMLLLGSFGLQSVTELTSHRAGCDGDGPRWRRRSSVHISQKALSLAAVGRHLLHDPLALEQVQTREALAQLARLRVAHVDAVADREPVRGGAE